MAAAHHNISDVPAAISGRSTVPLAGVYALLTLMVAITTAVVIMFVRIDDTMRERFVSKESFDGRMAVLESHLGALKSEMSFRNDTLLLRIADLSSKVQAAQAAAEHR